MEANSRILTQNETLNIWTPLHDEFIQLVVDSCESPRAKDVESLGRIFANCDEDWVLRASSLLLRYQELRRIHNRSGKPERRGEVFFELRQLVRKRVELRGNSDQLAESDLKRAREIIRRDYAKRTALNSEKRRSLRKSQARDGKLPTHAQAAKIICDRLDGFDPDNGIEQPEAVMETKLADPERSKLFGTNSDFSQPFKFPTCVARKVMRCWEAPVEELVNQGLVTSGDVLARLVPQIAGRSMTWRFEDIRARRIFLQTYRAFRARRSLLLLHLQKQVQFEELPWVKALSALSLPSYDSRVSPKQTFVDVAVLNLASFPYAIVPNKLLQELRALANAGGLSISLLDELAADIFMGLFSRKFGDAACLAATQLHGSLYSRYYEIDTAEILGKDFGQGHVATGFAEICHRRAGITLGGWSVAANGCVIEQQQILTTQNLATLLSVAEVRLQIEPLASGMVKKSFTWLVEELLVARPNWHSRLIAVKNSAYAWRQMMFFLSSLQAEDVSQLIDWMDATLVNSDNDFVVRFRPVLVGLRNVAEGRAIESSGGKQFLGWTTSRHWLLGNSESN